MSRNSSGTYSLPGGNPVVTGTTITSSWANTTLSDIATALTDSLSRTGLGGMQAGLPLFDGTLSLPGLSWATELTSGFYRAGANDYRWVNSTTELLQLTSNLFRVSGTAPAIRINEGDAAANNRLWDIFASAEDLNFRTLTDALVGSTFMSVTRTAGVADFVITHVPFVSQAIATFQAVGAATPSVNISSSRPILRWTETGVAANNGVWQMDAETEAFRAFVSDDAGGASVIWLQVDRTGTTVDTINFPNGTLQYGGAEVGWKGFAQNSENSNFNVTNTFGGVLTYYTGSGHTATIQATFLALVGGTTTIANHGSGNLTIATASGTLQWLNGSGAVGTGSRTLAIGGVCTITSRNGTGNPYVWGTGLS
jgi:hypothetical protein